MAVMPWDEDVDSSRYSLAELEDASGIAARTIRFYQSEGLLPRPARRGTTAVYSDQHLERLRAIAQLKARGLRLQTIRQMLNGSADAGSVIDLLGPDLAGAAWLRTSARTFDEGELADLLGDLYPDQVPALVTGGYLQRTSNGDGRGVWFAPSVPQMIGALELHKLGTSIELAAWSAQLMRTRMRELFEEFAVRWTSEAGHLYAGEGTQAEFEGNLEAIRSVVWQSAAHVAAEEIERVIHRIDEIRAR